MEGHCSTGQSPQWAVVPMEEEVICKIYLFFCFNVVRRENFENLNLHERIISK